MLAKLWLIPESFDIDYLSSSTENCFFSDFDLAKECRAYCLKEKMECRSECGRDIACFFDCTVDDTYC